MNKCNLPLSFSANQLSPTNSLSATTHSIVSIENSCMYLSISIILSDVLELPLLGKSVKSNGNATPLYTTPNIRMLISVIPNFQFVLSKLNWTLPWIGKSEKISRAIKSESNVKVAINRCSLRIDESALLCESKALASLWNVTVYTLHNAIINIAMSFTLARFIFELKCWSLRIETNSLILRSSLVIISWQNLWWIFV